MSEHISKEFLETYPCEFCNNKTLPSLNLYDAEYHKASAGVFIIRRHKQTGEETRRSVLCYQCMRKAEEEDLCNHDEKPFMAYTAIAPDDEDK
jgi:hypothetical protein